MLPLLATLCTGLFAGAAGYISLVEHWARLRAGTEVALAQFRPGFPRARAVQAALALIAAGSALGAWFGGSGGAWLLIALVMVSVVVFTLTIVAPVYDALVSPALTAASPEAPALLARWGRLHHARSLAGLLAFLLALASLSPRQIRAGSGRGAYRAARSRSARRAGSPLPATHAT